MSTRLSFADDGVNSAAYSYLANSPLVGQILFQQSGTTRMTTSKQYDYLNRLSSISSTPSDAFAYQYNAANQRTVSQLWDGSYWRYAYDALGQVTSGSKSWVDGTPVAGQQFDYAFDTIGNRTQTEAGGDQSGLNLRVASYTNNSVNEITSRGVPAAVDVLGDGLTTNSVTVNGTAAYRKSAYFREQLSVTNTAGAVWDGVTVAAPGQTSVTGHVYVAQNPETYTYDADGNLLSDGRWTNVWDGENRLVSMTSLAGAPSGSQLQLVFAYDYAGRRIQKMVSTNNGSAYVGEYTNNYVYDGWNLLAEVGTSGSLVRGYLWGADLSGRVHGAGGVGGLVEVTYYGAVTTNCFVAYDGGGNVSALVNAVDGSTLANYDYGPFGEVIRMTGPMAGLNPFRFSTKYEDDESGFFNYGFRYYNPSTGGWLNRDPIAESGGLNLYGFVGNAPIENLDPLGLYQAGGHYYTTFIATMIATDNANLAYQYAYYSQMPDQIDLYTAWAGPSTIPMATLNLFSDGAAFPFFDDVQRFLHSLDGGLAKPRRDCLKKLLEDPSLEPWERGMVIHAYGDSYAHSKIDTNPGWSDPDPYWSPFMPNPTYGQEILYEAPLGHGVEAGSTPDYVVLRPQLFGQYFNNLVTTLNKGPLTAGQQQSVNNVLAEVNSWPSSLSPDQEIAQFAKLANQRFSFNNNWYRPENYATADSWFDFINQPNNPRDWSFIDPGKVKNLIEKIKKACKCAH